jgi:hypothetical protein
MKQVIIYKVSSFCSAILIFVYIYSGLQKIIDFDNFKSIISKSPLLPNGFAKVIAYSIITLELLIAFLFFIKKFRVIAFLFSFFLLLLFTGYIILMLLYSPYLPCSCGGFIEQLSWSQHILFNLVLLMFSLGGFLIGNKIE